MDRYELMHPIHIDLSCVVILLLGIVYLVLGLFFGHDCNDVCDESILRDVVVDEEEVFRLLFLVVLVLMSIEQIDLY